MFTNKFTNVPLNWTKVLCNHCQLLVRDLLGPRFPPSTAEWIGSLPADPSRSHEAWQSYDPQGFTVSHMQTHSNSHTLKRKNSSIPLLAFFPPATWSNMEAQQVQLSIQRSLKEPMLQRLINSLPFVCHIHLAMLVQQLLRLLLEQIRA